MFSSQMVINILISVLNLESILMQINLNLLLTFLSFKSENGTLAYRTGLSYGILWMFINYKTEQNWFQHNIWLFFHEVYYSHFPVCHLLWLYPYHLWPSKTIMSYTFTTAFPTLSPLKRPKKALGMFSKPWVMVSLYFILPWN